MRDLSSIQKDIVNTPERCAEMKQLLHSPCNIEAKFPEEALAFLLDNSLSKECYIKNKSMSSKSIGTDIWPPYNLVRGTKEHCRPASEEKMEQNVTLNHFYITQLRELSTRSDPSSCTKHKL